MSAFARLCALLLALAISAGAASAQRDPWRVSAQLSSGVARLGQEVYVQLVVENGSDVRIVSVPAIEGLEMGSPQGPSVRRSMSMVNGRTTQSTQRSWRIPLRPRAEGDYEIPPFELEIDGRVERTRVLTLRVVRDLTGEDLGFLELTARPARVVEGQPFSLEILFGWDAETKVNLADLLLPWWGELPGAVELADRDLSQSAQRVQGVTVNGRIEIEVEEIEPIRRDGREFRAFRFVKSFVPGRPGSLEFPTSFLEFGQLVQARSLLGNARKETFFVQAAPLALEIVPLPSEGQPYDFSGAVGSLEVRASADTRDVVAGDSIKLDVSWTGSGNLEFFEPPDLGLLDDFRGFRVYGRTEEKSFERRRVTYDLAPLDADLEEIPAVPLTVFDPETGSYGVVASEPIPIRVRPLEGRTNLESDDGPRFERDMRDIDTAPLMQAGSEAGDGPSDGLLVLLTFAVPSLWLTLRSVVRRRGRDPNAPLERRRRKARRVLIRRLAGAESSAEKLSALTEFLAARAREPEEAWVGRDPRRWAHARGRHTEGAATGALDAQAEALADVLRRLERAVYGAGGAQVSDAEILAAAEGWQRAQGEVAA